MDENRKGMIFLVLDLGIGNLLSTFGTTWVCKSAFPTVLFMNSKFRSTASSENVISKLRCAVGVKHTVDFEDLIHIHIEYEIYQCFNID